MFSFKLVVLFAVAASAMAEPPRRQRNFRAFARQESADNPPPPASEGYNYEKPSERLRLPSKFRAFARQEEASSGGYSYPKPTDSYGPPEEETEDPSTEYGAPEATTANPDEFATESDDDAATDIPQAETLRSLQASQYRRKNAKFNRIQKSQKLNANLVQPTVPLQQPVFYVQYPTVDLVQPQYVYVFK